MADDEGPAPPTDAHVGHDLPSHAPAEAHAGRDVPADGAAHAHAGHAAPPGLPPHDDHAAHGMDHSGHESLFRDRFFLCTALSIPVLALSPSLQAWLGFAPPPIPGRAAIGPLFAVAVFAVGGVPFMRMARPEIAGRRPGMMTLISLAIGVAFVYSLATVVTRAGEPFFWELVTLIDIMLLGHWLEMRSVRQASGALDALARLMPDTAERIGADGAAETVPVAALRADDLLLIRPGARVPADGVVVEGRSELDESLITGESRPVAKAVDDRVVAGTVNGDGSLRLRVTATGQDTALAGIMRLVAEAQRSKSRTQLLADRAAALLFYAALATAALTAIGWLAVLGWDGAVVERVVTVLVIACPHALGLAVPLVVAITTTRAARHGILVRDRLALERARLVDVVVFDKTGTLTEGAFGLADMALAEGVDAGEALALLAGIEGDSEHRIARAVRRAAEARGVAPSAVEGFEALAGRGARARHRGAEVYAGGPRLIEELGLALPPAQAEFAARAGAEGATVIHLVREQAIAASFALTDVVRPESRDAIDRLHALGVEVAMLTGDSDDVAHAVARTLGIDRVFARVLPEDKARRVADLQARGRVVAMVGDGVNDAPALARADVGVAIGSGTDVAVASAGIILVRSDPGDVVSILGLSRASYRKMMQNLWWASGYNLVALPLAAGLLAPWGIVLAPAVGAVLMSLSTVLVALNAQLLRRSPI